MFIYCWLLLQEFDSLRSHYTSFLNIHSFFSCRETQFLYLSECMLAAVGTASAQGTPKERYQFDSDLPPTEVPPSNLKVSTGGVNLAVLTAASVRHHFAARAKAAHRPYIIDF